MTENKSKALKEKARANARDILSQSASFQGLNKAEQFSLYKDIVDTEYQNLVTKESNGNGHSGGGFAQEMAFKDTFASVDRVADTIGDIKNAIDFPDFVKDLVTGVFDANTKANQQQMEAYTRLLKEASKSLSEYVNNIKDDQAMMYLASDTSNGYQISYGSGSRRGRRGRGGSSGGGDDKMTLTDASGSKMDDNELKAKLMEAKLAMAKEQRAMLRETILMGVSRLVVESGTIRAEMVVDVSAVAEEDRGNMTDQKYESESFYAGYHSWWGGGFGYNNSKSRLQIQTGSTFQDLNASGKLKGFVELNIKSDYFKLDNFANMYGGGQANQNGENGEVVEE